MIVTRALKRSVRDWWWTLQGSKISNPPLPANPQSVIFLCLGNICRSPFAEAIAVRRAQELSARSIRWASAGLRTNQAAEPPAEARAVASAFGVSIDRHRPRAVTRALLDAHDMIVVMESHQRDQLGVAFPDVLGRTFLLPLFDEGARGSDRFHIEDPFAQPRAAYEACYRRIEKTVVTLIRSLRHSRSLSGTPFPGDR